MVVGLLYDPAYSFRTTGKKTHLLAPLTIFLQPCLVQITAPGQRRSLRSALPFPIARWTILWDLFPHPVSSIS
jgi:hypothetical protein